MNKESMASDQVDDAVYATAQRVYNSGGVIAYPTEAVFGLGCDPDNESAVKKLLAIKQRPIEKGLILLAADYSQLLPYIDETKIPADLRLAMLSRWPAAITQIVPANINTPAYLTGQFSSIAVRVTDQPDVVQLCNRLNKPIVSTSANLTGEAPANSVATLDPRLVDKIDYVLAGDTLGNSQPSQIIDALTGEIVRA